MNNSSTGLITRIYKNAAGNAIAIDNISVSFDSMKPTSTTIHWYAQSVKASRTLLHLGGAGGSRVVSSIQSIGNYDSLTTDSGNFLTATWNSASNNIEVGLAEHVSIAGDTI